MKRYRYGGAFVLAAVLIRCLSFAEVVQASPIEAGGASVLEAYEAYYDRFQAIENRNGIAGGGFRVVEDQIFPLEPDEEDSILMVPAFHEEYNRLAVFIVDRDGRIIYRTEQLETNYCVRGRMRQPTQSIAAVSFQDLNQDGRMDIVLITSCLNESGVYAGETYKVGDVLFQKQTGDGFYRDYRISETINRFGMNKSADSIAALSEMGIPRNFCTRRPPWGSCKETVFRLSRSSVICGRSGSWADCR